MIKVLKENNYFSNNEDVERALRDMKYKDSNEKAITSNNVFDGYSKALPTPNDGRYLYGFNLSDAVDAIKVYYGYKNRREAFDAIKDVSEEDLNKAMAYMVKKDIPFTFESVENDYVESEHSKQELNEDIKDYMDKLSVNYMGKIFNQMRNDGWDGSQETADSYFDAIMKKIDPNYKSDNDLVRESKSLTVEDEEDLNESEAEEYKARKIKELENDAIYNFEEAYKDWGTEYENKQEFLDEFIDEALYSYDSELIELEWLHFLANIPGLKKYYEKYKDLDEFSDIENEKDKQNILNSIVNWYKSVIQNHLSTKESFEAVSDEVRADSREKGLVEESKKTEAEAPKYKGFASRLDKDDSNDIETIEKDEPEVEPEDENKTILDYLLDRIGEEMTVGELNMVLQSLFGKYNTVFITLDIVYNQDPEEEQELVVWDDEDMYTITYNITDVLQPIIEINNVTLE